MPRASRPPPRSVPHPLPNEQGRSRYEVLADALRAHVMRGEWPPGIAIPAEQTLAAQHGVALGTLRRALELLAADGLIERIHGRGTFVRSGLSGPTMLRFFRFQSDDGGVPTSRIVTRRRVVPPPEVARTLGAGRSDQALHLHRVRSQGGAPCLVEQIWLPLPQFRELERGGTEAWGDLLYPLYAERCGVRVHRAVEEIRFDTLSAVNARHLALPPGHPCALITRAAFDIVGHCVEVRKTRGDAHAFVYTITLT